MKPSYKQTEVGVIPEDWEIKRLNEVADLQVGFAFKSDWFGKHIGPRLLRGENVGYGTADWSDTRTLEGKQEADFSSYLLNAGEVVIGMDRTFTKTGSKITLISEGDCPCLLVQRVGRFVPRKCEQSFLWFVLSSETVQARLRLEQKGMDIPHLSRSEILHPFAIFPPLPEQRAIAEALSDVDGLLGGLDRLIAKKRGLKQAAMQQLLTGQTRLPGFHGEWEVKRLGEVGKFLKGSGVTKDQTRSGTLACVRYGELYTLHNDVVRELQSWISPEVATTAVRLNQGDILFAGSGETKEEIGKCAAFVSDIEAYAGGDIVILRPDDSDSVFLGYYLNTGSIARQKASRGQGDAVVHISSSALSDVRCKLPPHPEQTAIASVLSEMDGELAVLEQRREKTRALKQAMMQELLTGRTRLL
jgi:type I restriction enzyme S subunit